MSGVRLLADGFLHRLYYQILHCWGLYLYTGVFEISSGFEPVHIFQEITFIIIWPSFFNPPYDILECKGTKDIYVYSFHLLIWIIWTMCPSCNSTSVAQRHKLDVTAFQLSFKLPIVWSLNHTKEARWRSFLIKCILCHYIISEKEYVCTTYNFVSV